MSRISEQTCRWRDAYNPLRGLTIARVVALREAYDRGEMADVQWTFRSIERSDADLLALVERRTAAILEMDWNIKVREPKMRMPRGGASGARGEGAEEAPARFDEGLAEEQAACLEEAYSNLDNLYEAIEHLSLAAFRGFAHLQKQSGSAAAWPYRAPGGITHLEPVNQWNVVRDGSGPRWKYNEEARSTGFTGLPDSVIMEPAEFVILTCERPIDHYGLPKFVRTSLGEKDWTAFTEIYGIPGGIVILPPNIPSGHEEEYAEKAQSIAEGAAGALPNGADYKANDGPRGVNPFRGFLDYFTEKLVLVGTGGLLTMLTQSGSGTLAGSAHQETFRTIARGQGRRISECLQKQFDLPILQAAFPGKPVLAYFELDLQAENNTTEVVDQVLKLSQAGYQVECEQVTEKTGYKVEVKAPEPAPGLQVTTKDMKGKKATESTEDTEGTDREGAQLDLSDGSDVSDPSEDSARIRNSVMPLRKELLSPSVSSVISVAKKL
jgi:phage gp29-like protein